MPVYESIPPIFHRNNCVTTNFNSIIVLLNGIIILILFKKKPCSLFEPKYQRKYKGHYNCPYKINGQVQSNGFPDCTQIRFF
jgi:hypothetical protein